MSDQTKTPVEPAPDEGAGEIGKLISYVVLLAGTVALYMAALDLPASRWEPVGAGGFPRLVLLLLGLLCVIGILTSVRRIAKAGIPGEWTRRIVEGAISHRIVFYVFIDFVLYLGLMRFLGFSIASFLFLLSAQLIVAPRGIRSFIIALVISVLFSFGLDWAFSDIFNVYLPRGLLG